jgi:glycerol-3-phosphate acyltransferase PlsY
VSYGLNDAEGGVCLLMIISDFYFIFWLLEFLTLFSYFSLSTVFLFCYSYAIYLYVMEEMKGDVNLQFWRVWRVCWILCHFLVWWSEKNT